MAEETAKIEETLENIFQFVDDIALEKSPQSITAALRESLTVFYTTFKKNDIELRLDIQKSDIILDIDARKIRMVFMYLIRNSLESLAPGGKLQVELFRERHGTTVNIIDSGRGETAEELERPDDPLYATKTYGTSLGLAFVEQILELHNAKFTQQQLTTRGSIVSIFFPTEQE